MPVRKSIAKNAGLYFITFTCYKWLPLIEQTKGYDLVYKWFDYLKTQGHSITGYVIMPNPAYRQAGIYMYWYTLVHQLKN